MKKMKQKEIRNLIKTGAAVDITNAGDKALEAIEKEEGRVETVAISLGVYGRNGQLLKGEKSGKLYAIRDRAMNLFWKY